jgi:hypothetical protein
MNDFEKILEEWLDMQPGTTINDTGRIDKLISAAKSWEGTEIDLVDSAQMVLTEHTKLRKTVIDIIAKNMKIKIGLGEIPKNHYEFVCAYCKKYGVRLTLDKQISVKGAESSDRDVFNDIYLWTGEFGVFNGKDYILAAWQKWKCEQDRLNIKSFYENIAYSPTVDMGGWSLVVDTLCADIGDRPLGLTRDEYRRVVLAVMQGAIWRVKAKLLNRPTLQHIMMYLRGKQGCGKSSFMRWFLAPVTDGMIQADFGIFDHDEKQIIMKNTPIIFFDEVARAEKADAAKVKNMMTSETGMFRKLYGEASKGRMVSTFFGAGNLDLAEVFHDSTGLRRFFQIECRKDLYTQLGNLMSQVDPLDLWRSVNENEDSPLENDEIVKLLISAETTKRVLCPVEEWIKTKVDGGGWPDYKGVADMFLIYQEWKKELYPNDRTNLSSFSTQIGRILRDGDYPYQKRLDPKTRRSIYQIGEVPEGYQGLVVALDKTRATGRRPEGVSIRKVI